MRILLQFSSQFRVQMFHHHPGVSYKKKQSVSFPSCFQNTERSEQNYIKLRIHYFAHFPWKIPRILESKMKNKYFHITARLFALRIIRCYDTRLLGRVYDLDSCDTEKSREERVGAQQESGDFPSPLVLVGTCGSCRLQTSTETTSNIRSCKYETFTGRKVRHVGRHLWGFLRRV